MLIPSRQSKLGTTMPAHILSDERHLVALLPHDRSRGCSRSFERRAADVPMFARHSAQTLHTYRTSKLRYHAGHRRAPLVVARPRSRSSRASRDKRKPTRREGRSRVDRARTLLNEKTWKRFCEFPPLDGRSPAIRSIG